MPPSKLDEEYVQNSFHTYLKSSLTQAKVERLIEDQVLASAEADLMISGAQQFKCLGSIMSDVNNCDRPSIVLVFCCS
jgi:DICT domain-containing protein